MKRNGQRSLRDCPSCHLSYQMDMLAPFLINLEIDARINSRIVLIPAQKKDLFLDGCWNKTPCGFLIE